MPTLKRLFGELQNTNVDPSKSAYLALFTDLFDEAKGITHEDPEGNEKDHLTSLLFSSEQEEESCRYTISLEAR